MASGQLAVGVDLVRVQDVSESIQRFGDRYVRKVFTEDEIAYCRKHDREAAERFAARFAAKEAVIKVLRPRELDGVAWKSIEIRRADEGWCDVVLHGEAAALARRNGISDIALSMSHEHAYATATAIARRAIAAAAE